MLKQRLLTSDVVIIAGSILLVIMGALPILFSFSPFPTFKPFLESSALSTIRIAVISLFFLVTVFLIAKLDSTETPNKFFLYTGFLLLSFFLTDLHFYTIDVYKLNWQMEQYTAILAGQESAPHQYRFLPQGILWWMFMFSGDFIFSYLIYRLLFTFVVCLSLYKLSRLYNSHKDSLLVVLLYAIYYPLSIRYYYGNLLDPMFHSVFILALTYCQKRKFWRVFFLLTLGMFIKETIILVVPCYYLLNMESLRLASRKVILRLSGLIGWGLLLFLAIRIPFHFRYDLQTLNGLAQLMILSNLGFPQGLAKSTVPVYVRYLHPILFIFMWLPILIFYRKFLSRSLFYTSMYLAISFYLTNLCFGWNHESRNFIPALSMLSISAVVVFNRNNAKAAKVTEL